MKIDGPLLWTVDSVEIYRAADGHILEVHPRDPEQTTRGRQSARLTSAMTDHVLTPVDAGPLPDGRFAVLRACPPGRVLTAPVDPARSLWFAFRIALAVAAIHRQGYALQRFRLESVYLRDDDHALLYDLRYAVALARAPHAEASDVVACAQLLRELHSAADGPIAEILQRAIDKQTPTVTALANQLNAYL